MRRGASRHRQRVPVSGRNQPRRRIVLGAMTRDSRSRFARPAQAAAVAILLAFVAACAPAGPSESPGSSTRPTTAPTPTSSPVSDRVQHPTGTADVLLRMESGGGLVPMDFFATNAPSFTLYGNGTVVFRDPTISPPGPGDGLNRPVPFQTIRLDEEGIQAFLVDAIERGGLGIAAGPYMGQGADLPTTTFTITADGRTKDVSVTPLSPEMHSQNAAIVTALAGLAERLNGFGGSVAGEQPYLPTAFRGVLSSIDQPFGPVVAWPWSDIKPTDFTAAMNTFRLLRTMTPTEVAKLGIKSLDGGLTGVTLQLDGKLYSLALRPLLPDESN